MYTYIETCELSMVYQIIFGEKLQNAATLKELASSEVGPSLFSGGAVWRQCKKEGIA